MFKILKKDENSRARVGFLEVSSGGKAETPAYAIVGTHGEVKTLSPEDLRKTKTQIVIANTYHLLKNLGKDLNSFEGLHKKMDWDGIIMTDSGGFQVFSLGFAREHGANKITGSERRARENLVHVGYFGAKFKDGNFREYLTPKKSIQIQEKLGGDIIFAFDECTSPFHDKEYNIHALERTHRWAKKCIKSKIDKDQMMYGVIQGGAFKDLREESAKFISSLPFDGVAIGGSFSESFGDTKSKMVDVLDWTIPLTPEERPRHLLGIGGIGDIFEAVERGIDTFDCVIPTREGRHGSIWTKYGRINLMKSSYKDDSSPLECECDCQMCKNGTKRGELREMFKEKDLRAGHIATFHNVRFFNRLMEDIRESIKNGNFKDFKKRILSGLK